MKGGEIVPTRIAALKELFRRIESSGRATKAYVGLADQAVTLTPTQIKSGIIAMTPTTGRAVTVPTAANIIASIPRWSIGDYIEFTILSLAAQTLTVTANTGVTLVGPMTVNNAAASFIAVIDTGTSVKIYRK